MEGHPCPHMRPARPDIVVPNDSPRRVMACSPELLGVSLRRVVWRFGFQPGSPQALACGVWVSVPVWVLAVYSGTVLDTYRGSWMDQPPAQFINVLLAELEREYRENLGRLHPGAERVPAASAVDGG